MSYLQHIKKAFFHQSFVVHSGLAWVQPTPYLAGQTNINFTEDRPECITTI
jgi:hypothetical protein